MYYRVRKRVGRDRERTYDGSVNSIASVTTRVFPVNQRESDMVHLFSTGAGLTLILMGVLAVINHPIVDKFERVATAWGTKQTAADIERSRVVILGGRIAGVFIILWGISFLPF